LLVTFLGAGGIAVTIINVVKDWLLRNPGFKVRIKRPDGAEVELAGIDPKEVQSALKAIQSWIGEGAPN
jgi:hypothetical protein